MSGAAAADWASKGVPLHTEARLADVGQLVDVLDPARCLEHQGGFLYRSPLSLRRWP
jgi:hypothetical protein